MGKNPAFQFYPSDWTRDMDDQDLEIEGAWIRIICRLWWSEKRGEATKTLKEWARILRKTDKKTMKIFQILFEKHIASGSLLDNQNITIISRRIVRDNEISQIRRASGVLGGNPKLIKTSNILDNQTVNQKPTPSSSSSSSIKNNKKNIIGIPPKIEDIKIYCSERGNGINPEQFFDYYESRGWMIGKNKMKNWQAAIRTWEKNNKDNPVKPADTEDYIGKALRGEI
jgi:hypothetical protein